MYSQVPRPVRLVKAIPPTTATESASVICVVFEPLLMNDARLMEIGTSSVVEPSVGEFATSTAHCWEARA